MIGTMLPTAAAGASAAQKSGSSAAEPAASSSCPRPGTRTPPRRHRRCRRPSPADDPGTGTFPAMAAPGRAIAHGSAPQRSRSTARSPLYDSIAAKVDTSPPAAPASGSHGHWPTINGVGRRRRTSRNQDRTRPPPAPRAQDRPRRTATPPSSSPTGRHHSFAAICRSASSTSGAFPRPTPLPRAADNDSSSTKLFELDEVMSPDQIHQHDGSVARRRDADARPDNEQRPKATITRPTTPTSRALGRAGFRRHITLGGSRPSQRYIMSAPAPFRARAHGRPSARCLPGLRSCRCRPASAPR